MEPKFDFKMMVFGKSNNDNMNSYPVLKMIMFFYTYLAIVFGGIIFLIALKSLSDGKFSMFILYTVIAVFTWAFIKLSAEGIQLVVNIADNTRRAAESLDKIERLTVEKDQ